MENKQVVKRVQISQWVRLIIFDDGSVAIWQGANRVELSAYESSRVGYSLLDTSAKEIEPCSQSSN
jgi:hypothetical protein